MTSLVQLTPEMLSQLATGDVPPQFVLRRKHDEFEYVILSQDHAGPHRDDHGNPIGIQVVTYRSLYRRRIASGGSFIKAHSDDAMWFNDRHVSVTLDQPTPASANR